MFGLGFSNVLSDNIAIDLGTANTLVYVEGRGVIINEPSVVAIRSRGGVRDVLAVGEKAKQMLGRTPESIETIRPLRDGVIADFIATEEMLRQFIRRTKSLVEFIRPRILICVPAGATPVERRAVYETALSAGARKVFLVEEPVAAAIGAGLPIDEPKGSMVVDIGGGTTDVAVLSLGGVVQARSIRCGGNAMDEAIVRYVRRKHQLVIGEANAERIKIEAGSASRIINGETAEIVIRGREMKEGKAKTVVLGPHDIAEALEGTVEQIAEFIQHAIEDLPPEISTDICERGIYLSGGGAKLTKLNEELERRIGVKVHLPEVPEQCVITGTAAILRTLKEREHLLIRP
ncbi:rod shape-determining protein [Hyphomicrobium sp.]|uniref:rod shape-determining protein n=1 Tax=Hyphomicrobium sp. TaxID=82 RepID=UPI000FA17F7D|nr:rod shape-determining protein [Hyphomicrobium sp.]MBN9246441.1 rod shape-determining protein [Hyphomicrobium sp.]RUP10765.1 MAG: rod shape-determining protein [Hyphomicrobium sp.]